MQVLLLGKSWHKAQYSNRRRIFLISLHDKHIYQKECDYHTFFKYFFFSSKLFLLFLKMDKFYNPAFFFFHCTGETHKHWQRVSELASRVQWRTWQTNSVLRVRHKKNESLEPTANKSDVRWCTFKTVTFEKKCMFLNFTMTKSICLRDKTLQKDRKFCLSQNLIGDVWHFWPGGKTYFNI